MFEWLKDKLLVKEIIKVFWVVLKVMVTTGLMKVFRDSGSIEIFEFDGALVVGLNSNDPVAVREAIGKLGGELAKLNLPTFSIQQSDGSITVRFNEKHREEVEKYV